jgi:hypothetical protein
MDFYRSKKETRDDKALLKKYLKYFQQKVFDIIPFTCYKWLADDMFFNLDRMATQAKYVKLTHDMLGGIRDHFPLKYKVPKPEIELSEVLEIVKELNDIRRNKNYDTCIYVNICEDSKFYVGITSTIYLPDGVEKTHKNAAYNRLADHRCNGGKERPTYWTFYYPTIANLCYFPGDHEDENNMTLLMAKCVTPRKVRGGLWCTLSEWTDDTPLQTIIQNLKNR